jgi:ubiquinone/menaquinone biosynthesis C-methylase UbiE
MSPTDYTSITELPASLLTPDQLGRFAQRYGYAHRLAQGQRVLEVACGAGGGLSYLAKAAVQVMGLDYTGTFLTEAQNAAHVPLTQGDAQRLPYAGGSFDLVLCFEAIYYLEDYRLFLAECRRVLAPGGVVLICQSNPDWPDFVPGALTATYPTLPELTASLVSAGFHDIKSYGALPITTAGARQKLVNRLRRWGTLVGILSWLSPLTTLLKRLSYGQLEPLPRAIDAQWVATWQANLLLTPLSPTQPDWIHRVVYVEGRL